MCEWLGLFLLFIFEWICGFFGVVFGFCCDLGVFGFLGDFIWVGDYEFIWE